MEITSELGQEIIKRLAEYIDVDINIMDLNGKIVASTDKSRINELHCGAVEVLRMNEPLILKEEDVQRYPGTKPGANLPIMHQNKISGVVGVSGNPKDILRITGLIRASVEMVIEQIYIQRQAYYEERQWNNWLHQLLHPSGYSEEKLKEDAVYSLKINTDSQWRVIVLHGAGVQDSIDGIRREIVNSKITALFTLPFAEDEIVITISSTLEAIKRLTERLGDFNHSIGVGE
ncbi:sugar diacid recognition domain-containing protein [Virgibacillus doumboii]|uniref:sugar diacid recognition domain-containing protein n=1 Tax=Virgibacillus doumboii TaxID=2697503 RepID=UPI0013DEBC47|nr:sugar diacid recognition domain-containing protein [Virgibacillus doumboii]